MRKFLNDIAFLFSLVLLLNGLCGCENTALASTVQNVVVLSGQHSNSMSTPIALDHDIRGAYTSYGTVSLVVVDGNPSIVYDDAQQKIGHYDSQYTEEERNARINQEIWERDYLIPQTETFLSAIAETHANDPEVDTLSALHVAANELSIMSNEILPTTNSDSEIAKKIIINDTGLCTTGSMSFLSAELNHLLYSDTKIADDEKLSAMLDDVLNTLDEYAELPNLTGIVVTWYGIGMVAEPQEPLSNLAIENLQYIWSTLLIKAGAVASHDAGTDSEYGFFVKCNPTTTVDCAYAVTPITPLAGKSEPPEETSLLEPTNQTKSTIPTEVFLFAADSTAYADNTAATKLLNEYAKELLTTVDPKILLVGITSSGTHGGSKSLASKRAEQVKLDLVELGASETWFVTYGLGYDTSSELCNEDQQNGTLIETLAASNRTVWALSWESDAAKQIRLQYNVID